MMTREWGGDLKDTQSMQYRALTEEFLKKCAQMLDIDTLVRWLGPAGAKAGLLGSDLTLKALIPLAKAKGLPFHRSPPEKKQLMSWSTLYQKELTDQSKAC